MNDKNRLYTRDDLSKDAKDITKRVGYYSFANFSGASKTSINDSSLVGAVPSLQPSTQPNIGDPINDSYGTVGNATVVIPLDVYGSNYSVLTIDGDIIFRVLGLPRGRHLPFTLDITVDKPTGTPPTITFDSRTTNPPVVPTLVDGQRLILRFVGANDSPDVADAPTYTYVGGTIAQGGGGGGLPPHDMATLSHILVSGGTLPAYWGTLASAAGKIDVTTQVAGGATDAGKYLQATVTGAVWAAIGGVLPPRPTSTQNHALISQGPSDDPIWAQLSNIAGRINAPTQISGGTTVAGRYLVATATATEWIALTALATNLSNLAANAIPPVDLDLNDHTLRGVLDVDFDDPASQITGLKTLNFYNGGAVLESYGNGLTYTVSAGLYHHLFQIGTATVFDMGSTAINVHEPMQPNAGGTLDLGTLAQYWADVSASGFHYRGVFNPPSNSDMWVGRLANNVLVQEVPTGGSYEWRVDDVRRGRLSSSATQGRFAVDVLEADDHLQLSPQSVQPAASGVMASVAGEIYAFSGSTLVKLSNLQGLVPASSSATVLKVLASGNGTTANHWASLSGIDGQINTSQVRSLIADTGSSLIATGTGAEWDYPLPAFPSGVAGLVLVSNGASSANTHAYNWGTLSSITGRINAVSQISGGSSITGRVLRATSSATEWVALIPTSSSSSASHVLVSGNGSSTLNYWGALANISGKIGVTTQITGSSSSAARYLRSVSGTVSWAAGSGGIPAQSSGTLNQALLSGGTGNAFWASIANIAGELPTSKIAAATADNNKFLRVISGTATWVAASTVTIASLNDIGNVSTPTPLLLGVLQWSGSAWVGATIADGNVSSAGISATKITSGTLSADRIPNLSASKITSGTLSADRIPNLSATKITSGRLTTSRLPLLTSGRVMITSSSGSITISSNVRSLELSNALSDYPTSGGSVDDRLDDLEDNEINPGAIASSLIPADNRVQDLGTSTKQWDSCYVDDITVYDDITVGGLLRPDSNKGADIGTSSLRWDDCYVDRLDADSDSRIRADLEIDGDLNHDGSRVGFYGFAPLQRQNVRPATSSTQGWTRLNSLLGVLAGMGLIDNNPVG